MTTTEQGKTPPGVLVLSGNDPAGGAGIQADIQAITALSAHPAPVITALTVLNAHDVTEFEPVAPGLIFAQTRAVLADIDVRAIKIGMLANVETANAVADLLASHAAVPVVLDPVLAAPGSSHPAAGVVSVIVERLLPLATVLTPNAGELLQLAPGELTDEQRAMMLVSGGARWVLLKGADDDTPEVHNILYGIDGETEVYNWSRLPQAYLGAGCTLASAIAALLAHGEPVVDAVAAAQRYTWEALRRGFGAGKGRYVPHRFFHLPSVRNS